MEPTPHNPGDAAPKRPLTGREKSKNFSEENRIKFSDVREQGVRITRPYLEWSPARKEWILPEGRVREFVEKCLKKMMARVSRSYGAQASILHIKANKNVNEGGSSMVGRKYDQNKMPLGRAVLAYFHKALLKVAEVSKKGAEKYGVTFEEQNWRQVEDGHLRYMDAAARHIAARLGGEVYDPESGLPHLAHAAWDCLAALELDIESSEQSDNIASEEEAFIDGRSTKQLSECYDYIASWNDGYPSDPVRFIGR